MLTRMIAPLMWSAADPAIITWWDRDGSDWFSVTSAFGRIFRDPQDDGTSNSRPFQLAAWGGSGDDSIKGGDAQDYIAGNKGHDFLQGMAGNDILRGDNGHDTMIGGDGDDHIFMWKGNDEAWGGEGSDTFYARYLGKNEVQQARYARIEDYDPTEDTIVFKNVQDAYSLSAEQTDDGWMITKGDDLLVEIVGDHSLRELGESFEFAQYSLDQVTADLLA